MPVVLKPDPFAVTLLESPALVVTPEQNRYIREILETACSDSRFADKAYWAINRVLTGGVTVPPVVTSLNPSSVVLGSPDFQIHVMGTGFTPGSIIVFAGQEEPTTHVSATELTTGVNMSLWLGADAVPVAVLNENGVISDPLLFTFNVAGQQSAQSTGYKTEQKVFKK